MAYKIGLFGILCLSLTGCVSQMGYNIIDITDDQWLVDNKGNRCIEKEMIVTPDAITYYYESCAVTRIVRPKPHILPKPGCSKLQCSH